jgi:hypothetical protein
MVAIWRGKDQLLLQLWGVRPLSVLPPFECPDVEGSSANEEAC